MLHDIAAWLTDEDLHYVPRRQHTVPHGATKHIVRKRIEDMTTDEFQRLSRREPLDNTLFWKRGLAGKGCHKDASVAKLKWNQLRTFPNIQRGKKSIKTVSNNPNRKEINQDNFQ